MERVSYTFGRSLKKRSITKGTEMENPIPDSPAADASPRPCELQFGCGAPPLTEQTPLATAHDDADAVAAGRLYVRGYITALQVRAIEMKIANRIAKR